MFRAHGSLHEETGLMGDRGLVETLAIRDYVPLPDNEAQPEAGVHQSPFRPSITDPLTGISPEASGPPVGVLDDSPQYALEESHIQLGSSQPLSPPPTLALPRILVNQTRIDSEPVQHQDPVGVHAMPIASGRSSIPNSALFLDHQTRSASSGRVPEQAPRDNSSTASIDPEDMSSQTNANLAQEIEDMSVPYRRKCMSPFFFETPHINSWLRELILPLLHPSPVEDTYGMLYIASCFEML